MEVPAQDHPPRRERLDPLAELPIRIRLAPIAQVTGEHERLRRWMDATEPVERELEMLDGVDHAVLESAAGEQVGVAEVGDDVTGVWVLAEWLHGKNRRTTARRSREGRAGAISGHLIPSSRPHASCAACRACAP